MFLNLLPTTRDAPVRTGKGHSLPVVLCGRVLAAALQPLLQGLEEGAIGMLFRRRTLGQHPGSLPIVGRLGETLGICLQQHIQLLGGAVTRSRHVNWEPSLLVAHLGGVRSEGEHLPAQLGADVVGEDYVKGVARSDASSDRDGGRVGMDESQKELLFRLGLHLAVALCQDMDGEGSVSILDGRRRGTDRQDELDQSRTSADVALGRDCLMQNGRRDVVGHCHGRDGQRRIGSHKAGNLGPPLFLAKGKN